MDWRLHLFTYVLAFLAGGATVYFYYGKVLSAWHATDSGVKSAVDAFHKVKADIKAAVK